MRLGIMLRLPVPRRSRRDLGEGLSRGLVLAAEAGRLGASTTSGSANIMARRTATGPRLSSAGRRRAAAAAARFDLSRIGQGIAISPLLRPPAAACRGSVGARATSRAGGRAQIGFGQGYRRAEFRSIRPELTARVPAPSRRASTSCAWPGKGGGASTTTASIYKTKNGLLRPAPVQRGSPAAGGSAGRRAGVRARAVRHRAGLMIASPDRAAATLHAIRVLR